MRWVRCSLALLALSSCLALECPASCRCEGDDLLRFYCSGSGTAVRARDDGFMEVECEKGTPLNCSSLPPLPVGDASPLQRLEVTRCKLSPSLSLAACAVRRRGSGTRALALQQALGPVSAENVAGMEEVENLFMVFVPGAQTSVPVDAINALPSLRVVRLLSGSSLTLHSDMFAHSPPLTYLELSMSGLPHVPPHAFRGLSNLTILSLWGNKIANVSVDGFAGLHSVEDIRLNSNPLPSLPARVFAPLPRLRRLCLERLVLGELREGVVSDLPALEQLKLRTDVPLTLGPRALSNLPSLTSLSIRYSKIPSLPADLFHNTPHIVNLSLSDNRIREVAGGVFGGLRGVQRVDLAGNMIEALERDAFRNMTALVELNLDRNRIKELPDQVFSGLSRLRSVSIANNLLESISFFSFVGAESLRSLSLSHNRLAWGGDELETSSPFHMLHNLERLSLSYNNISYVYSDWRFVLRSLSHLDLSHNAFQALSLSEVQFLPRTSGALAVDFTSNRIALVQPRAAWTAPPAAGLRLLLDDNPFCCDCRLYDFLLETREDSKYSVGGATCASPPALAGRALLSLAPREMTCDVPDVACDCRMRPALARVECDCRTTRQVPDISESGYKNMSLRLRSISTDLRSLPDTVAQLNLTGLHLDTVPSIPASVRSLDLTNNNLRIIPQELLNRKIDLYLSGNPLTCDCFTTNEFALLKNHSEYIKDFAAVTCEDGRRVAFEDAAALCDVYKSSVAGALCAALVVLLACVVAVLYRFRVELQVYLYSRGWCLGWLSEEVEQDKQFDAFVSFAPEDEKFVCEELLPRLRGYSLQVAERDWEAGACIPAQLRRSIAQSRRSVIVLSRRYLRSVWARETLRATHAAAAAARRRRGLVLLTDLARRDLDDDTATYLALATVLELRETLFWEKLIFALPRGDFKRNGEECRGKKDQGGLRAVLMEGKLVNEGYVKDGKDELNVQLR